MDVYFFPLSSRPVQKRRRERASSARSGNAGMRRFFPVATFLRVYFCVSRARGDDDAGAQRGK